MTDNHHLTGPAHYEQAELAAERARDLLEGRDHRYRNVADSDERDLVQEVLEGHAWAAVAQAHVLLAQTALRVASVIGPYKGGDLSDEEDSVWALAIQ
jgi:hypothetical protein